jgi:hypothetical protein
MKAIQIYDTLRQKKGQHVQICWQRAAKILQSCAYQIEKQTIAYCRSGINYANLAQVKESIELGLRGDVQSLPWGQWDLFPFIISHKGVEYVRLYPAVFDNLKPTVNWFMNSTPMDFSKLAPYLQASEKKKEDEKPICFTVKAESVRWIGE